MLFYINPRSIIILTSKANEHRYENKELLLKQLNKLQYIINESYITRAIAFGLWPKNHSNAI
jgi:hypothetical protein